MPIRIMVMARRKPGLSAEEFRDGYENSHSRIAVRLFGHLWISYRRSYVVSAMRFRPELSAQEIETDEFSYDAISEFVLPDERALEEMSRVSRENSELIRKDEEKWFDQKGSWTANVETIEEDLGPLR